MYSLKNYNLRAQLVQLTCNKDQAHTVEQIKHINNKLICDRFTCNIQIKHLVCS